MPLKGRMGKFTFAKINNFSFFKSNEIELLCKEQTTVATKSIRVIQLVTQSFDQLL